MNGTYLQEDKEVSFVIKLTECLAKVDMQAASNQDLMNIIKAAIKSYEELNT